MTWIKASQLKNLPLVHTNTEAWLTEAIELFRPIFEKSGLIIPKINVLCGFGVDGYKPDRKLNGIGECHPRKYSKDEANDIYITPILDHPTKVLEVLAHEIIHAINDCADGHGPMFQDIAKMIHHPDYRFSKLEDQIIFEGITRPMALTLGRYPRSGVTYRSSFHHLDAEEKSLAKV
jgi:hypothetical protein